MKKYYKTELHTHTNPVSGCSDIEAKQLVNIYKEKGYDSVVLTNHFTIQMQGETIQEKIKWYLEDYYKCFEQGALVGLNVILGAEIRFTENNNDYLIFGICPDDLFEVYKLLPCGIDNFYREFKTKTNIIIQAHPFRDGMENATPKSLDGIEVFNLHPNHNSRIGLAARYACENNMIVTCGSDFHHYGQECLCGILTKKPLKNSYDVSNVLKSGDYNISIGDYLINI
ncbi:MAG: PHP domain-containing protein [Ruminococcaceae bacterium]|nr:PHP domain-containing protein [Oscillospiraceae bacterium]